MLTEHRHKSGRERKRKAQDFNRKVCKVRKACKVLFWLCERNQIESTINDPRHGDGKSDIADVIPLNGAYVEAEMSQLRSVTRIAIIFDRFCCRRDGRNFGTAAVALASAPAPLNKRTFSGTPEQSTAASVGVGLRAANCCLPGCLYLVRQTR